MPRRARLDAAGVLHHVIIRGIERRRIFLDDGDRQDFLNRCAIIFPETKTSCYAFALLSNHAHLLLRTGDIPLSTTMARLLTGYAAHFNRAHGRHGQLFQNRYKSIVCQEDLYLKELVCYIHLNPVRAHVVSDVEALATYPYSGHASLMGNVLYSWQETAFVLSAFGTSAGKARASYLQSARQAFARGQRKDLIRGGLVRGQGGWSASRATRHRVKGDVRILGDSRFVLSVLSRAQQRLDHRYRLKSMGVDFSYVEKRVLQVCGVSRRELYGRGRQQRPAAARGLLCFWSARELGLPQTLLSARLGITQPGVAAAIARGEKLAIAKRYVLLGGGC